MRPAACWKPVFLSFLAIGSAGEAGPYKRSQDGAGVMAEAAIRTDALTRSFGAVRAVDALTIEVPRGVVFGFLGPNGSGKTTTIRLLLGLLAPDSGSARVLGLDPGAQGSELRARCGALLEF